MLEKVVDTETGKVSGGVAMQDKGGISDAIVVPSDGDQTCLRCGRKFKIGNDEKPRCVCLDCWRKGIV